MNIEIPEAFITYGGQIFFEGEQPKAIVELDIATEDEIQLGRVIERLTKYYEVAAEKLDKTWNGWPCVKFTGFASRIFLLATDYENGTLPDTSDICPE